MECSDKSQIRDAMRSALETEGPVLLDVRVSKDENCFPMIPAGAAALEMVEYEEPAPAQTVGVG